MSLLGNRVVRTEDPRFLTGDATFVGDIPLDGAAHVVFIRSIMAHAVLGGVDASAATTMPGVLAVIWGEQLGTGTVATRVRVDDSLRQPLFAAGRVRYVGEPIAAVVAETVAQAQDAAENVLVDYDPLTAVVGVDQALEGSTLLFDKLETNVINTIAGPDQDLDFSVCDVVIDHVIRNPRMAPVPLEGRVGAADWSGEQLTVWASCQGAGVVKEALKDIYDLSGDSIRVIAPDIGGGFGAKGSPHREELALAGLSRAVGRPVRWSETRSENLVAMVHGRGQQQRIRMGGTAEGRITHYALHVVQDSGAYAEIGALLPVMARMMLSGTYNIENASFSSQSVVTNTTPIGAFRGAGRPEATAAIERAVDLFASAAGLDPADVRRTNLVPAFDDPHTNATGTKYDVGDYPGALNAVLEAAGYERLRAEQELRRTEGSNRLLGIGLSSYVEITAIGGPDGSSEYGTLELRPDGSVLARSGSTPQGQGHETAWAMVIADQSGIAMDQIEVVFGDTDQIPSTNVTGGSRSAQVAGSAMLDASVRLVDKAKDTAARLLEANVDDIVLDAGTGSFHVTGTPAISVGWQQVAEASPEQLSAESEFVQPGSSFPFGAHCAVVEVDRETGAVTLLRHVAVDDCGTMLNPMLVEGQVHGGLAAGAAQALLEEVAYDEYGTPQTSNFADYGIISAAELPSFERIEMVTPSPLNPLGAKGIGESGTIGATPAVQNAVVDALAHLGVTHIDMPCTAERVWRALANAADK